MVVFETNYGSIKIELDNENTPKTAANFLDYVESGFYDGTIFHRVIAGFMIQGGGFEMDMQQKQGLVPIDNEADLGAKNMRGTLAMARTNDPHSASCQFFINAKDNNFLDFKAKSPEGWGYCVFGRVVEGMDVVDKIEKVATGNVSGHQDVPVDDVIVIKAYPVENESAD